MPAFVWPECPTLRFIIHWALRPSKGLCEPEGCDNRVETRDEHGGLLRYDPCDGCAIHKLADALSQSAILHRAFDLDFALTAGVTITLDEIDVEEFRALKILRHERTKYENELNRQATRG